MKVENQILYYCDHGCYFDGGYYKKALKILEGLSTSSFTTEKEKVEFTYRAGRIYHAGGEPDKAKGFYAATIKNGSTLIYYYTTAAAALQLAIVYEEEKNGESQNTITT